MEAEDARLAGYTVIDVKPWEDASGGKAVACQGAASAVPKNPENGSGALAPAACTADWTYSGSAGRFDIAAQYFDLQGGIAHFALDVNGKQVAAWDANGKFPSRQPHGDNSTRYTAHDIDLKPGDVLRVAGAPDGADPAALDYIELTPSAK
jgi:alpha-glucuronidase